MILSLIYFVNRNFFYIFDLMFFFMDLKVNFIFNLIISYFIFLFSNFKKLLIFYHLTNLIIDLIQFINFIINYQYYFCFQQHSYLN